MRRVAIDFRHHAPKSFMVSRPGDINALFSPIAAIAARQGLKCKTQSFKELEMDLSTFLAEEFPGQHLQLAD